MERPEEIDIRDPSQVEKWCRFWKVTERELADAIQKVGSSVPAVAFALGKEAYGLKPHTD
jgi:hypothetical protein